MSTLQLFFAIVLLFGLVTVAVMLMTSPHKKVIVSPNYDLILRLRMRASIRRNIQTRKSVQLGQPDRIADLLEEAANALEKCTNGNR
jgi:hypothetical protein